MNECRLGRLTPESISVLRGLNRPLVPETLRPVELYALRRLAEGTNQMHLDALPGQLYAFRAIDGPDHLMSLPYYSDMPVDPLLCLKSGAQVMLRKNLGNGLVNGSIGKVVSFHTEEELHRFGNDHVRYTDGCLRQVNPSTLPPSSSTSPRAYPVICFTTPTGLEHVFCQPEVFQVEDSHGQVVAMRTQVLNRSIFDPV